MNVTGKWSETLNALVKAIAAAGGSAERAILVGDSATDIRCARAANVRVIAVAYGYADVPVAQLEPDRVIAHFDELAAACDAEVEGGAAAGSIGGETAVVYRVYKRRWFGLVMLMLLNIIVSWDVSKFLFFSFPFFFGCVFALSFLDGLLSFGMVDGWWCRRTWQRAGLWIFCIRRIRDCQILRRERRAGTCIYQASFIHFSC